MSNKKCFNCECILIDKAVEHQGAYFCDETCIFEKVYFKSHREWRYKKWYDCEDGKKYRRRKGKVKLT